jgi:hypothetical protein
MMEDCTYFSGGRFDLSNSTSYVRSNEDNECSAYELLAPQDDILGSFIGAPC